MWNLLLQHKLWQNLYIIIYLQNQHGLWTIACLVSLHLLSIALYCKVGSNLPTHLGQILTGALLKKLAGFFWVKCSLVLNRFAIEWRLVTNRPLCLAGQQNCKNAPFGSLLDAFPCNWPIVVFTMRDITLKSTFFGQLISCFIALVAVLSMSNRKVLSGLFHKGVYTNYVDKQGEGKVAPNVNNIT